MVYDRFCASAKLTFPRCKTSQSDPCVIQGSSFQASSERAGFISKWEESEGGQGKR